MASREIILWLDERWYDALERQFKGESLKDKLEDYLDELVNQLPSHEYERISNEIFRERQEQEAARRQLDVSVGGAGGPGAPGPARPSPVRGVIVGTAPSRTDGFSRTDGPGSCPQTWDS